MSCTSCILPYIHLYAEPNGEVKPCCIAGGFKEKLSLRDSSVDEVFNSPQMKELRKTFKKVEVLDLEEGLQEVVILILPPPTLYGEPQ